MCLNSFPLLVVNRPQLQVALLDTKGFFGFRQLYVSLPELFRCPVRDVGAQQVAAFRELRPLAMGFNFLPSYVAAAAIPLGHFDVVEPGGSAIAFHKSANSALDGPRLLLALRARLFELG